MFQEKRLRCHQNTAPSTTSAPEAQSPEHRVPDEPQTSPGRSRRVLPHHNRERGCTHRIHQKLKSPHPGGTDSLLHPLFSHLPLCNETRLKEHPRGPFPGIPLSPQHLRRWQQRGQLAAGSSPETATCSYKIVRKKNNILFPPFCQLGGAGREEAGMPAGLRGGSATRGHHQELQVCLKI